MRTAHGVRQSRWWIVGALAIGILASGVVGAVAQTPTPPAAPPLTFGQIFWNPVQQRLSLTTDQVTYLQTVLEGNRTKMQADRQALRTAVEQLRTAWRGNAAAEAIVSATQSVQTARNTLALDRLSTELKIRDYLNAVGPDKWEQWRALHRRHGGMRGGRGFGMGM